MKTIRVAAGIIIYNGKILIAQRRHDKTCANLWEFPGGKIEQGETMQECLRRELQEELNLPIIVGDYFMTSTYAYDFGSVELNAYWATSESENISFHPDHEDARWISLAEIDNYDFPPADKPILEALKKELRKIC